MKSLLMRYILCCHGEEAESEPRQVAHRLHTVSGDSISAKDSTLLFEPSPQAEAPLVATADTPGVTSDAALTRSISEEKPSEGENKGEPSGTRKPKRKKRHSRDKAKLEVQLPTDKVPDGMHEPLPRDAKPKKSILKKR